MTPDDRREALVDATIPLLHEHGRTVTTKQIADAAGVAEGTIFRVFDSKDDLVTAAVDKALDMEPFFADLESIDLDQDLRARLTDLCRHLQDRFRGIFLLMSAMGMVGPPKAHRHMEEGRRRAEKIMVAVVEARRRPAHLHPGPAGAHAPDAHLLRDPPPHQRRAHPHARPDRRHAARRRTEEPAKKKDS